MQTLGKFLAFLITLFISVLLSFLQTYIIISIAGMYDVDFITNLSFMQVFGAIFIFSLVAYNGTNNKKEEKFDEMIKRILTNILTSLNVWAKASSISDCFLVEYITANAEPKFATTAANKQLACSWSRIPSICPATMLLLTPT